MQHSKNGIQGYGGDMCGEKQLVNTCLSQQDKQQQQERAETVWVKFFLFFFFFFF